MHAVDADAAIVKQGMFPLCLEPAQVQVGLKSLVIM